MLRTLLSLIGVFVCLCSAKAQNSVDTKIYVNSNSDDKTFVVIISNENYKQEENVPFAKNDGEVFKIYCQKTLGIPDNHIHYAPDATLGEMNFAIYWLGNMLNAYDGEARAIVYYSGHGMPDEDGKEAYLLPVDGFSQMTEGALSTKKLYGKLKDMKSDNIIVLLDACFSGAKRDGKMLNPSRGVAIKVKEEPVGDNTVVFSAATGDETAYPFKSQKHGLFTYYVLDKMQQAGGCTTLGELSDYVTQQVRRRAVDENNGKSQTPTVIASTNNRGWRNWRFAPTAAKKFETRSVATAQAPKPAAVAPVNTPTPKPSTPTTTTTTPVQSKTTSTNTPTMSMDVAADVVAVGKKYMRAMNYDKAKSSFIEAANQGSIEAHYQLGMLYSNSNFDGYNKETATRYFLKAANNNHVEAMYQAGMMYLGTDNSAAKSWFRKASERGHSKAQAQLSRLR